VHTAACYFGYAAASGSSQQAGSARCRQRTSYMRQTYIDVVSSSWWSLEEESYLTQTVSQCMINAHSRYHLGELKEIDTRTERVIAKTTLKTNKNNHEPRHSSDHDNKTARTHWREEAWSTDKSERKRPPSMETAVQHQHQRQSVNTAVTRHPLQAVDINL